MVKKRLRIAIVASLAIGLVVWLIWPRGYCRSAHSKYGITVEQCPDGELLQSLRITGSNLRRGGVGAVQVDARALYTVSTSDAHRSAVIPDVDVELELVAPDGKAHALEPQENDGDTWHESHGMAWAEVALPDASQVPDGDYLLRAHVSTKVGDTSIDLPLALYAPARIHILTDRPLYEPGNTVQFRALVVRARDLAPLDHRPGTWLVSDPSGNVLLEEKAPAGQWGVVSGSFPLDRQAQSGTWHVTWRSGADEARAAFRVEPFTLPRFRVEATPERPFYVPLQNPTLSGLVAYSSGAPVAGAAIELSWRVAGDWPPPTAWLEGQLPTTAQSDAAGRFAIDLPAVPADLQGQVTLIANISAVDPAGDRVASAARLLLSQDAISVQAMTEMGGGLVAGSNNRVYLRVTAADGRPLPGAKISVERAWSTSGQELDGSISATLDADSVARIQIDPGPPVNVVIPAPPARRPRKKAVDQPVRRTGAEDLYGTGSVSLADQVAMDKWLVPLQACGKWVARDGVETVAILQVTPAGAVATALAASASRLDSCVQATLRRQTLPRGVSRLYSLRFRFRSPPLPELQTEIVSPMGAPEGLEPIVVEAALDARDCLARDFEGELPWPLSWQVKKGQRQVRLAWIRDRASDEPGEQMPAGVAQCVQSRLRGRTLTKPAARDNLGLVRYAISQPGAAERPAPPQPTIMKGYELLVAAEIDGQPVGQTKLRMQPGSLPRLRLRADPVLAEAGEKVELTLIRGPSFTGSLPKTIYIKHFGDTKDIELADKKREVTFEIPPHGEGWYEFTAADQRALVYVRPKNNLALALRSERARYAPGARARLNIKTEIGGAAGRAAVGLFGVDSSLAQLTPLPGPDELAGLRLELDMTESPFGVIDGKALVLGRIRGRHAAEATVLRVASVPEPAEIDVVVNASAETRFDPVADLTDRYYIVLSELYAQTRTWEKTAAEAESMTPQVMAGLWNKALEACQKRGQNVADSFGRKLRLHRLPGDLLALTDPRHVVVVGTRLPEDVENWQQWVRRNRP